ncbi:unnamed protein product [Closterium sp. NIES-53]
MAGRPTMSTLFSVDDCSKVLSSTLGPLIVPLVPARSALALSGPARIVSRCPAATPTACPRTLRPTAACESRPAALPSARRPALQPAPSCPAARASRCPALRPARRLALQLASHTALPLGPCIALPLGPCIALPCSPARRTLLPCPARAPLSYALRPTAARASHPTTPRVAPYCSPRVTPCCPARRALLQPARRTLLLCPARALLPCPPRALPCSQRRALPCPAAPPSPAEPRRPAQATLPNPSHATLPHSPAPPSCPAATTAAAVAARATVAAGGGAAGSAGGAAGTGGAAAARGGQQRSLPLPDNPTPQQLREWVIQQGSPGGGGFGFMGTAQRRQQRPHSTFSLQRPRNCASQRCVPGCVEATAPAASESATNLGARESADALGASTSIATSPASAKALHTFTLDSGASSCFFRDCTIVTPLAAPVQVSQADPTGGPVFAQASTVLPCPAVPSEFLSGLHLPAFSKNLLSNTVLQDVWVDAFIPGGQRVTICKCSLSRRHLATYTRQTGSGLYTLTTTSTQVAESRQVAASGWVSVSRQLAASCLCRVLSHQTLLWHHCLGHPSLPRLRNMHSRLLVSGLPKSLPSLPHSPAPPCLLCVEGRQRAAPHSSEFPPTTAPLQTLHMDVWGPGPVGGMDQERYFLLVVDDYTRYSSVFPLRRKAAVSGVLIPLDPCYLLPAARAVSSGLASLIMEVARTSMIHAAAPHFLWPFAVRYAAHQLNLLPRVFEPETSPTLQWTGKVGDASVFRVWGALSLVCDAKASKISSRTLRCIFLGFPTDAPPWQFYHPREHRVFSSQDVTFDEAVCFYRLQPHASHPGPALSAETADAEPWGAEIKGEGSGGAGSGGGDSGGAASPSGGGAVGDPAGGPGAGQPPQPDLLETLSSQAIPSSPGGTAGGAEGTAGGAEAASAGCAAGARGAAGAGGTTRGARGAGVASAGGAAGVASAGGIAGGARGAGGARAASAGGAAGAGGAGGAGGAAGAGGTGGTAGFAGAASTVGIGAASSGGAGAVGARGTGVVAGAGGAGPAGALRHLLGLPPTPTEFPVAGTTPPLLFPSADLASVPACVRRVRHPRAPAVPGTHDMTLRPSSVPQLVILPSPPASSLRDIADPPSDLAHASSPTVTRFLTAVVTDPTFSSPAVRALVAELVEFGDVYRLEYLTGHVSDPDPASPSSVGGTYIDEVPLTWVNIVSGMWIFKVKRLPGSPLAFKARYVARGFSQREGVNFFQTFSPTPKMTTLWMLHSLDFSISFFHGSLHEAIWLCRPVGFTWSFPEGTQWSLRQPVYGLSQAPREWHDTLRTILAALGFAPSSADPSLLLRTDTILPPFYVLVYVDDLVFATADTEALALVKAELLERHTYTNMGELCSYLGLQITRDRAWRTITLTLSHIVHQVLQRFGFQFSLPQPTPLSTGHSLSASPSDESVEPSGPYPELVGCLMTEAKIYAGAMATQELRWVTYLLSDMVERPRSPLVLYQRGQLRLAYVTSRANTADVFTKALGSDAPPPKGPTSQTPRAGPSRVCRAPAWEATSHVAKVAEDNDDDDKDVDSDFNDYGVGMDGDDDEEEDDSNNDGEEDDDNEDDDVAEEETQPVTPPNRRYASRTTSSAKDKSKSLANDKTRRSAKKRVDAPRNKTV